MTGTRVDERALVTAVIPAYNAGRTLDETLKSVRGQTWTDLEIVVVDDGSQDDTSEIAARHAAEDPRLRVVRVENGGAGAARNRGAREGGGAYVAFCDSDDLWHPDKIARQMRRMAELGPDCGLVYTLARSIDREGRVLGQKRPATYEGRVFLRLLVNNFIGNGSSMLVRREALERVGGFETRLKNCEDWHLQCAIARRWRVGAVSAYLTGYRQLPDSKSARNKVRHKEMHLQALRHILERAPETPRDVAAAAEASARVSLAIALWRSGRRREALAETAQALRGSPSAALEVFRYRTALASSGRLRRMTRPAPPPATLFDLDPSRPYSRVTPAQHLRRLERLRLREDAVFASEPRSVEDRAVA